MSHPFKHDTSFNQFKSGLFCVNLEKDYDFIDYSNLLIKYKLLSSFIIENVGK